MEPKSSTGSGSLANKLLQTVANKHNNDRKNRTRRGGKKHKRKRRAYFSLLGNNAAGIKAKKESLEALIEVFKKPSCITLQETKLAKNSYYQIPNYQVFQKNRNSSGGGLLTAVDPFLNPVQIETINEEAEILTIQIEIHNRKIRIINAYAPQNDDAQQNRLNFWLGVEEEIISAKNENCMIIIEMDANGKVGQSTICRNPSNLVDNNGRQLLQLMESHSLVLLNKHSKCVGTITRHRETKNNTETSILDYVLVCEELGQYLESIFC